MIFRRLGSMWSDFWFTPRSTINITWIRILLGATSLLWGLALVPDFRTFYFDDGLFPEPRYGSNNTGVLQWLRPDWAATAVLATLLVASLLLPGPLTRLLAGPPLVAVGQMSYSWYVVHWPVILIMTSDRVGIDGWPLLTLKVVASSIAAAALHLAVEQPLRAKRSSVAH